MTGERPVQVVCFKRDLRVHDHAPLTEAAAAGPVVALYVVEPEYWRLLDTSERQWRFVRAALADLDGALRARGVALTVCVGEAVAASSPDGVETTAGGCRRQVRAPRCARGSRRTSRWERCRPARCDVTAAMRAARARLAAVYGHPDFPAIARAVYERHGSRVRPVRPVPRMREARHESAAQLALPGVVDG